MWKSFTCLVVFGLIGSVRMNPVAEAFLWNDLVPDILTYTPSGWLSARFPSGLKVELGNTLDLEDILEQPTLNWEVVAGLYYTVMLVDPDVPSRESPENRSYLHWLVVNVPGTNIDAGETIASFVYSRPPAGSGPHRYVFLIYEQPGSEDFGDLPDYSNTDNRIKFSVENFASEYNLGRPLAGNFYFAQNSTTV